MGLGRATSLSSDLGRAGWQRQANASAAAAAVAGEVPPAAGTAAGVQRSFSTPWAPREIHGRSARDQREITSAPVAPRDSDSTPAQEQPVWAQLQQQQPSAGAALGTALYMAAAGTGTERWRDDPMAEVDALLAEVKKVIASIQPRVVHLPVLTTAPQLPHRLSRGEDPRGMHVLTTTRALPTGDRLWPGIRILGTQGPRE